MKIGHLEEKVKRMEDEVLPNLLNMINDSKRFTEEELSALRTAYVVLNRDVNYAKDVIYNTDIDIASSL
jgi:hypothetical protein